MNHIRIVLISDNLTRDYLSLAYVKEELERIHGVHVYIIGSVAEIQRIFYLLHKIQPHIVFITQLLEKCFRDIAQYVRKSNGLVIVLPAEVTYSSSAALNILNKNLTYDELFELYLVPGDKMRQDIMKFNIQGKKLIKVGSPKMDLINKKWDTFMSRKNFSKKYQIPENRKNIFIFSTFIKTPEKYIQKDTAYIGSKKEFIRLSRNIDTLSNNYGDAISRLCKDYPEYNFIVKPHPLESNDWYKGITDANFFVIPNEYIVNILKSVDLAIHWYSTVAIECWIKGIKTIQYAPLKEFMPLLGEFHFGNPVVSSYSQLKRAIGLYADNPLEQKYTSFQKKYINLWFGKLDGKCGMRIKSVIHNLIKNHSFTNIDYRRNYSLGVYALLGLEKMFGTVISRKIISMIYPYNWKYAWKNAILVAPNTDGDNKNIF